MGLGCCVPKALLSPRIRSTFPKQDHNIICLSSPANLELLHPLPIPPSPPSSTPSKAIHVPLRTIIQTLIIPKELTSRFLYTYRVPMPHLHPPFPPSSPASWRRPSGSQLAGSKASSRSTSAAFCPVAESQTTAGRLHRYVSLHDGPAAGFDFRSLESRHGQRGRWVGL